MDTGWAKMDIFQNSVTRAYDNITQVELFSLYLELNCVLNITSFKSFWPMLYIQHLNLCCSTVK